MPKGLKRLFSSPGSRSRGPAGEGTFWLVATKAGMERGSGESSMQTDMDLGYTPSLDLSHRAFCGKDGPVNHQPTRAVPFNSSTSWLFVIRQTRILGPHDLHT
ncbi:hypothetical protein CIHG_10463 [Coccidioides immitis H538.4]|uniref:Uncharacterized protein n=1 Tax=Coccidioides immitis H538.4 TaxID=396776 RepID=A0A0J8UXL9_COCIT|nr:hypothetical protein CIHG_10463 [Coccidioides immitis H538.4]